MVCKKCKAELEENATVCKECGTPVDDNIEILDLADDEKENVNTEKKFSLEDASTYALDFEEKNAPKRNKSTGIFTGLVIGLMVAVVAVIAVFFFMKKQMENKLENGESGTVVEDSPRVTFAGYTFTIPKKVEYVMTANTLFLGNEEGTWTAQIGKKTFDYVLLSKNLNQMKINATGLGFSPKTAKETKIGNASYITMELSANNENYLAAYTKASNTEIFYIAVYNTTNSFDHDSLKTVASVLKTAELATNHMPATRANASMVGAITG